MIPSDSIGGIPELRLGDIKDLRVYHQSLEESDLDLSFSAIYSYNCCLELRIFVLVSLRKCLNLVQ